MDKKDIYRRCNDKAVALIPIKIYFFYMAFVVRKFVLLRNYLMQFVMSMRVFKSKLTAILAFTTLLCMACAEKDKEDIKVEVTTLDATGIEATQARLNAVCTIVKTGNAVGENSFYYATEDGNVEKIKTDGKKVKADNIIDGKGSFSITISDLEPATQYYYVASVTINGLEYFGQIKSFTTKEDEKAKAPKIETLDVGQWFFNIVTIYGRISEYEDIDQNFECGIEYSTNEAFGDSIIRKKADHSYEYDNYYNFSLIIPDLQLDQVYYYRVYYQNRTLTCYGETKSFSLEWIEPRITTLRTYLPGGIRGPIPIYGSITQLMEIENTLNNYDIQICYGFELSSSDSFNQDSTKIFYSDKITYWDNDTIRYYLKQFDFDYGVKQYYRAFLCVGEITIYGNVMSFNYYWNGGGAMDLGLSVKWGPCNVGASRPWEYGDYYAWGEIEPYYEPGYALSIPSVWKPGKSEGYSWSSYRFWNESNLLTKYCTDSNYGYNGIIDNKTVLDPEDDIAHVYLGGDWRMPTIEEFRELYDTANCTLKWTIQNGVHGWIVTSKITGFDGNSIFLPDAGYREGEGGSPGFNGGIGGKYWSSTLDEHSPFDAYSITPTESLGGAGHRISGYPVRPVCP